MPWVRLDEEFPDHPKVVTAGPLAGWLHVCALAYCNRHLTDGFVPRAQVARLVSFDGMLVDYSGDDGDARLAHEPTAIEMATALVSVGMWEERQGGYLIHDFLDYQPSRAEIEAQRKVKRDAGRAGGIRSGESRRSRSEADVKQTRSRTGSTIEAEHEAEGQPNHEAKGQPKPKPDPDPDPDPSSSSSVLNLKVGPPGGVDDDEESRVQRATAAIVERRIGALTEAPKNPRAYRLRVVGNVNEEMGDDIERLAAEGRSAESIADELCPVAPPVSTSPAHAKWEPNQPSGPTTPADERAQRLAELRLGARVG